MATADASPIRVGLLGVDAATAAIARAVVESRRFELAGVCEVAGASDGEEPRSLLQPFGHLRRFGAWETLLDGQQVDVVVVARSGDDDLRAEQLRKLVQTGMPVLAAHPVLDSMLDCYELDMIRRDTGSLIVPYLPERHHPAIRTLSAMVEQGSESPLGRIEQVALQRRVAGVDKRDIVAQFARDVDVIRAIAGELTRLGAMVGAGEDDSENYAGLGVQMSGPSGVIARWSLDPVQTITGGQLTVLGTRGKAVVEMPSGSQPWSMQQVVDGKTRSESFDGWSAAERALDDLEAALAGEAPSPDWVDAARDVELAETIERSLEKSRTIELYYEDYTEEGTFKGTMTSVGCGLLLFGLCMMGMVAIGDHLGVPYTRAWPYVLAGGLGVFLLLQLLMLVFRQEDARRDEEPAVAEDRAGAG
jgi:predicted dehydrogenase